MDLRRMNNTREESKKRSSRKKQLRGIDFIVKSSAIETELGKKLIEAKIRSSSIQKKIKGEEKKKKSDSK